MNPSRMHCLNEARVAVQCLGAFSEDPSDWLWYLDIRNRITSFQACLGLNSNWFLSGSTEFPYAQLLKCYLNFTCKKLDYPTVYAELENSHLTLYTYYVTSCNRALWRPQTLKRLWGPLTPLVIQIFISIQNFHVCWN